MGTDTMGRPMSYSTQVAEKAYKVQKGSEQHVADAHAEILKYITENPSQGGNKWRYIESLEEFASELSLRVSQSGRHNAYIMFQDGAQTIYISYAPNDSW